MGVTTNTTSHCEAWKSSGHNSSNETYPAVTSPRAPIEMSISHARKNRDERS